MTSIEMGYALNRYHLGVFDYLSNLQYCVLLNLFSVVYNVLHRQMQGGLTLQNNLQLSTKFPYLMARRHLHLNSYKSVTLLPLKSKIFIMCT